MTDRLTDAEIDSGLELSKKATPGPVFFDSYSTIHSGPRVREYDRVESAEQWESLPETEVCAVPIQGGDTATEQGRKDAAYIEHAYNNYPRALEELRELRDKVARLKIEVTRKCFWWWVEDKSFPGMGYYKFSCGHEEEGQEGGHAFTYCPGCGGKLEHDAKRGGRR